MSKLLEIALGIVTSIGGYLDVGSLATAAQAGAIFRFDMLWVILLGTICVVFLVEMSGRFAAISKHTIYGALRERMGANYFALVTLVVELVNVVVLGAELGGAAIALQLVTGVSYRICVIPVALLVWLILWLSTFSFIENGVALLGLITIAFAVAAYKLSPPVHDVLRGLLPGNPDHDNARYWFLVVSIIGSIIAPYLVHFYSSGAIEEKWDESYLMPNRIIAGIGMGFGSVISASVLVVAAIVLFPHGIQVDNYDQAALILANPLGRAGFYLFAASLFIACIGAALELSLATGYVLAQGLGWAWGENKEPRKAARFSLSYTFALVIGMIPIVAGMDPLGLTIMSMALTALILPVVVFPFLLIMNDKKYLRDHTNGRISNIVVTFVIALAALMALVTIPLELMAG